jgi:hypothetical protein
LLLPTIIGLERAGTEGGGVAADDGDADHPADRALTAVGGDDRANDCDGGE